MSFLSVLVTDAAGGGDGYKPQADASLHRRGDDRHPPTDGLVLRDLPLPLLRVRVERLQPRGAPAERVRLARLLIDEYRL